MSRKSLIFLLFLIVLPVVVYLIWPSDESRIQKLVKEGAETIEKEDIDKTMSKVSFNYQDDIGLNYMLLRKILERQFAALEEIDIECENLSVRVDKDKATASLDVRALATSEGGGQRGYIFGDLKEPARLSLELEKGTAGRWLVVNASGLRNY